MIKYDFIANIIKTLPNECVLVWTLQKEEQTRKTGTLLIFHSKGGFTLQKE